MITAIIAGSVRKARKSFNVCLHLEERFSSLGLETDLIDMAETPLPIFDDSADDNADLNETIEKFSSRLEKADAMIFVTPEYNGSFSGVLKNTLDYFWEEFAQKPIGVAAVSSGKMGGINASTQLQHVILSLGAYPLPVKLLVPEADSAFDEDMNPARPELIRNTDTFIKEFLWFSNAVTDAKKRQLKEIVTA